MSSWQMAAFGRLPEDWWGLYNGTDLRIERVIMESRRNNGLYDDEIDEEEEDNEEYED